MCADPATMMVVGATVTAGGELYGGLSADKAGRQAQAQLEQQAQLRIAKGEYDAEDARVRFVRDKGAKVASAANSGTSMESFADVFADDAAEAALERQTIRYGAQMDAANLRAQGQAMRERGQNAKIGSMFAAAGSIFSAAGKARSPAVSPTG